MHKRYQKRWAIYEESTSLFPTALTTVSSGTAVTVTLDPSAQCLLKFTVGAGAPAAGTLSIFSAGITIASNEDIAITGAGHYWSKKTYTATTGPDTIKFAFDDVTDVIKANLAYDQSTFLNMISLHYTPAATSYFKLQLKDVNQTATRCLISTWGYQFAIAVSGDGTYYSSNSYSGEGGSGEIGQAELYNVSTPVTGICAITLSVCDAGHNPISDVPVSKSFNLTIDQYGENREPIVFLKSRSRYMYGVFQNAPRRTSADKTYRDRKSVV